MMRVEEESVKVGLRMENCTLPIKVQDWRNKDCCCVEPNPTPLTCWGYYLILCTGLSLSLIVVQLARASA